MDEDKMQRDSSSSSESTTTTTTGCDQCRQCGSAPTTTTPSSSSGGGQQTSSPPLMKVVIYPTTGGHFELQVSKMDTVEHLKKMISKKLKVAKERLCLLSKERQLQEGTLLENNIQEGNKITLLPLVETGLLTQRPEQSVLQALENLNDSQVNDFLSGKAPLNLTMRLGDHMMFIQLQLSTAAGTTSVTRKGLPPSGTPLHPSFRTPRSGLASTTPLSHTTQPPPPPPPPLNCPGTRGQRPSDGSPTTSENETCSSGRRLTDVTHLLDTRTLAEASRNLSQTLRHLSSQAVTTVTPNGIDPEECEHHNCNYRRQGAIIESMHHHGKGVYSGTFSGTLNPALQDRNGHPKRDISTIVHILNDLLGASPQYRRQSTLLLEPLSASLSRGGGREPGTTSGAENPASKSEEEFTRLSQENRATRGKMEQLQMMLEERRCRRRARRDARSPYAWPLIGGRRQTDSTIVVPVDGSSLGVGVATMASSSSTPTSPTGPSTSDNQMECETSAEGGLESDSAVDSNTTASSEYLKLNPGTVVA